MGKQKDTQGTLFEFETIPEPKGKEQKPAGKRTWLNCDIRNMTKREFINYCRKEYNRIHNIEEPSTLPKTVKDLQEDFYNKANNMFSGKKKNNKDHLTKYTYPQENKRLYAKIQAAAIKLATDKPYKELTNKEKDKAKPVVKNLHETIADFLINNKDRNNDWSWQKENYDTEDCLCTQSLKQYIKTYYESTNQKIPKEYTLRSITALLKTILPIKYTLSTKNKKQIKKYFSKQMITALIKRVSESLG